MQIDYTDEGSIKAAAAELQSNSTTLNVLINCGGKKTNFNNNIVPVLTSAKVSKFIH